MKSWLGAFVGGMVGGSLLGGFAGAQSGVAFLGFWLLCLTCHLTLVFTAILRVRRDEQIVGMIREVPFVFPGMLWGFTAVAAWRTNDPIGSVAGLIVVLLLVDTLVTARLYADRRDFRLEAPLGGLAALIACLMATWWHIDDAGRALAITLLVGSDIVAVAALLAVNRIRKGGLAGRLPQALAVLLGMRAAVALGTHLHGLEPIGMRALGVMAGCLLGCLLLTGIWYFGSWLWRVVAIAGVVVIVLWFVSIAPSPTIDFSGRATGANPHQAIQIPPRRSLSLIIADVAFGIGEVIASAVMLAVMPLVAYVSAAAAWRAWRGAEPPSGWSSECPRLASILGIARAGVPAGPTWSAARRIAVALPFVGLAVCTMFGLATDLAAVVRSRDGVAALLEVKHAAGFVRFSLAQTWALAAGSIGVFVLLATRWTRRPAVQWEASRAHDDGGAVVTLRGRVAHPAPVEVTIDGERAALDDGGRFSHTIDPRSSHVILEAVDPHGIFAAEAIVIRSVGEQ